jgi:xanthine dehydrogenase accessory factor
MITTLDCLQGLLGLTPTDKAVLITVLQVEGSVPRGAGTRMLVTETQQYDTIGGGHLEWKAIANARLWLAESNQVRQPARQLDLALGPSLGQCCGGALRLQFERVDAWTEAERQARLQSFHDERLHLPHLYLFGAGHVGQALVQVLQQTPCRISWVDERDHLFPEHLAPQVQTEATDTPEAVIKAAEPGAYYLVMTHHHGLDLILAEHILRKGNAAWFGLIGSKTKRARFEGRLGERGIDAERLQDMVCPIGIAGIAGKEPGVIAVAVAAQLMQLWTGKLVPRSADQAKDLVCNE